MTVNDGKISYVVNSVSSEDNVYHVSFNINQKSMISFNSLDRLGHTFVSRQFEAIKGHNEFEYIVPSNTEKILVNFRPSTNLKYKVKYIKSSFENNETYSERKDIVFSGIATNSCISSESLIIHKESFGLLVKVWGANKYLTESIFSKYDDLSVDNELINFFCDYVESGQDIESYLLEIIPDSDNEFTPNLLSINSALSWVKSLNNIELKSKLLYHFRRSSVGGDYVSFVPQTKITNEMKVESADVIEFKTVILARAWAYLNYLSPYRKHSLINFDQYFFEILESGLFFEEDVNSLLNKMGAYFQDAHINVVDELNLTDREKCSFPITAKLLDERLILTGFRDDSLSESNLEIGAEILQINGEVIEENYFDYFKYPSSNSINRINTNVLRTFYNVNCGSTIRLLTTYKDNTGEITLSARINENLEYYGNSIPKSNEVLLPDSVGYFNAGIYYKDSLNRIKKLLNKPHVVVDLRQYPSLENYELLPKVLLGNHRRGYRLNVLTKDASLGEFTKAFYSDFQFSSEFAGFSGQLYILVGEHTGSRAEALALTLSQYGKSKIIGSQTMGMNGTIVQAPLYNNHVLFFTGEEVIGLNNEILHHVGVPIDHKIEITTDQYLSGSDVHLNTVVNLYEKIKNNE